MHTSSAHAQRGQDMRGALEDQEREGAPRPSPRQAWKHTRRHWNHRKFARLARVLDQVVLSAVTCVLQNV